MNGATGSGRRCKVCGARLSSYNLDILCYPCQEEEEEKEAIEIMDQRSMKKSKAIGVTQCQSDPSTSEFFNHMRARIGRLE